MRSSHWTCDNYCGARRVGDSKNVAPFGWTALTVDGMTWTLCSRQCLVDFLYKSKMSMALGTKVRADIVGEHIGTKATVDA